MRVVTRGFLDTGMIMVDFRQMGTAAYCRERLNMLSEHPCQLGSANLQRVD